MFEHWVESDLTRMPSVKMLPGKVFWQDSGANLIGVKVTKDGEPYSLDYNVTGSTNKEKAASAQVEYFQFGNVDLLNRPQIPGADMVAAGWTDAGSGIATIYSSAYHAGTDGIPWKYNVIIHITPIRFDGEILSPAELDDYVDMLLAGGTVQGIKDRDFMHDRLVLWVQKDITNWSLAGSLSDEYDEMLHELQEIYYLGTGSMPSKSDMMSYVAEITSVKANVKRSDGLTITATGTFADNTAYVVLPDRAYEVVGMLGVYVYMDRAGYRTTLGGVEGYVYPGTTGDEIS